jgi:hypothetical protein
LVGEFHLLIDVEDLPIFADVKCPAMRKRAFICDDAVGFGGAFLWITEDGIVEL